MLFCFTFNLLAACVAFALTYAALPELCYASLGISNGKALARYNLISWLVRLRD